MTDLNLGNIVNTVLQNDSTKQDFDLDNWISDFEDGFPRFTKINPVLKKNYWGQEFGNRPRVRELNVEGDAQLVEGYRVVEFFPERENEEESYILFGTPIELMSQLTLLQNWRMMLSNKLEGVGNFVGYPIDEYLRAKPRQELTIQIILTTHKEPPFYKKSDKWYSKRQVTIPAVDKSKITYKALRDACGGKSGQDWGEWTARAYVSLDERSKGLHQIVSGGDTQEKAKANLEKFLQFTRCKIRGITYHQIDYTKGDRAKDPDRRQYNSFEVYPAWATVLNTKLVQLDDARRDGKKTLSGKLLSKKNKLYLYMEREPSWWLPSLQEVTSHAFD